MYVITKATNGYAPLFIDDPKVGIPFHVAQAQCLDINRALKAGRQPPIMKIWTPILGAKGKPVFDDHDDNDEDDAKDPGEYWREDDMEGDIDPRDGMPFGDK